MDNVTHDAFFAEQLTIAQPKTGHRIGTDAVLLAQSCPEKRQRIADLGAGAGLVGLRAAQLCLGARVTLFEKDETVAALAARNCLAFDPSGRVSVETVDVLSPLFAAQGSHVAGVFDCVLTNPPFDEAEKVRVSPDANRAAAHVLSGTLDDWIRATLRLLKGRGILVLIHRADRLADILAALDRRFGDVRVCFVHATAESSARRVIIRAVKGSKAPLTVVAPLVLHRDDGAFTEMAASIHAGDKRIDFSADRG